MAFFRSRKSKSVVGLDIGHTSVKGVELHKEGSGLVADLFGEVPIHFTGDSNAHAAAVTQAIKTLFSQVKFSTRQIVTAVSGESVIVRLLRMPYFSPKETNELRFAVESEARDFIPFEMEDVSFDYQVLNEVNTGSEGKALDVLIVAAQKELVNWYTEVVKGAGLDPQVVDVSSFALVNAVHYGGGLTPEIPVALVDIGSSVTNIAIMKGDTTRFTRDLSTAGTTITRAIMAELSLTEEEAEAAKAQYGVEFETSESSGGDDFMTISQSNLPDVFMDMGSDMSQGGGPSETIDQQVHSICEQFLGEIVSEVKRCLLFYENQLDGQAVDKVLLTGGTVRMKNADRYIESLLDTPTEILDPFQKIGGRIQDLDPVQRGTTYAVSLGLAMRGHFGGGVS